MNLDIAAVNDLVPQSATIYASAGLQRILVFWKNLQQILLQMERRSIHNEGQGFVWGGNSLGRISLKEVNLRNVGEYCQGTEK